MDILRKSPCSGLFAVGRNDWDLGIWAFGGASVVHDVDFGLLMCLSFRFEFGLTGLWPLGPRLRLCRCLWPCQVGVGFVLLDWDLWHVSRPRRHLILMALGCGGGFWLIFCALVCGRVLVLWPVRRVFLGCF